MHDEKLRAVGVRAGIGHGHRPSFVIAGKRFIIELIARAAGAVALGIAALDHKALNDTMEYRVIVKILFSQPDEIISRNRRGFRV